MVTRKSRAVCFMLLLGILLVFSAAAVFGSIYANPDYGLLVQQLMKGNGEQQQQAWEFLYGCGDPRLFPAVKKWLGADDPQARRNCASLLAYLPQPEAMIALMDLLKDKDRTVRINAVNALGERKDPAMIAVFVGLLTDADLNVVSSSAKALADFGEPAVEPLLAALEQADPKQQRSIFSALGRTRDPRAVAVLRKSAASPDIATAQATLRALGHDDPGALEEQLARWPAADAKTRAVIVEAIQGADDPRADELLHAACRDADKGVRSKALGAVRAGDPQKLELVYAGMADPDPGVRFSALVLAMYCTTDARLIDALLPLLDDPSELIRQRAAERLTALRDPRMVDLLLARLAQPGCPHEVIEALGNQGDPRVIPFLISLLTLPPIKIQSDVDTPEIRMQTYQNEYPSAAERALEKFGQAAVELLINAMTTGEPTLRATAARLLGQIDDPRCLPALAAALRDPEVDVRAAAINALDATDDARAYEHIIPLLNDPNPTIRREAVAGLSECRDPRIFEPLSRLLSDRDPEMRLYAVLALCDWEDPRVPSLLLRARKDAIEAIYGYQVKVPMLLCDPTWIKILVAVLPYDEDDTTIKFLQKAEPALAVPALLEALRSTNPIMRKQAAKALSVFHEPRVIVTLGKALTDRDAGVREEARNALAALHDPAMLPAVQAAITQTKSPIEQAKYFSLLGDAGPAGADPLLALMAKAEGSNERQLILAALAKTGSPRAAPAAIAALHDVASWTRQEAIHVLGQCGGDGAGDALLQVLADPDQDNRNEAAAALGTLKERKAVEPLLKLLAADPHNDAAIQALGEIGDPRASDALLAVLQKSEMEFFDGNVLSAAALALGKLHEQRAADRMLALLQRATVDRGGALSLATALGELRDERAVELLAKLTFTDEVIVALGKISTPRAADILATRLQKGESYYDIRQIGEILGAIRDDKQQERVLALLHSDLWRVRWAGAYALGIADQAWAIPPAIKALADPQPQTRAAAAEALGRLKAKEAGPALTKALTDLYPEVRAAAKKALAAIGE